jgi:hypothetical protein
MNHISFQMVFVVCFLNPMHAVEHSLSALCGPGSCAYLSRNVISTPARMVSSQVPLFLWALVFLVMKQMMVPILPTYEIVK